MEAQIKEYCLNFHALRQNRPIQIEEWLDVCVFVMIESNMQIDGNIQNKEDFTLNVLNVLIEDTLYDENQRIIIAKYMIECVTTLKKQLLKNDYYCCLSSILCC